MKSFKKLTLVIALTAITGLANAASFGGNASGFGGSFNGNAGASSTSNAQTATENIGTSSSFQSQGNISTGGAGLSGKINSQGVNVATSSFGTSVSTGSGQVFGNAPLISSDGSQSILNGGAAGGVGIGSAGVTSQFVSGKIGGSINLNGANFGTAF